jgi:iron complex outermembrane receptor protein
MRQIGFCLSALLLGSVVNAQDVLKPLVVTGQREVESNGNVDVSEIDAERVSELLGHVPGLAVVSSDSAGYGDTLAVRGSANTLFFGGAGVAMVVDDVPFGDVFTYSTEFFDLDSFTLHRGPQGSRFARNGAGGLIEIKTAGPTDTPEYRFSAEYGSYDLLNLRFRASGPINDKWSYTLQSYFKERNGYIDNENPAVGGFNDTREQFGALGSLYFSPSADLEVRFRAMYERVRDGSQRLTALPGVASAFGPLDFLRAQDPFRVNSDLEGVNELDRFQLSLHFDQDLGWANLKSITSYQNWQLGPSTVDLDLTSQPASTSSIGQEQELWSQEFRLESDDSGSVRWTAGLAYLWKDTDGNATRFFGTSPFTFANQTTSFSVEEESVALFGNVQWDANENLTFEGGGRLEYVESALSRSKSDTGNTPGFPALSPTTTGESEGWYFSPSIGVNYALTGETSLFARTSTSFKPQGFTAFSDDPSRTSYDEERAWETEVGLRYQNSANTLGFEVRGFYKQIDDYQLNTSIPFTTDFIIVNADRVEALGVEGELFWKPTDRLTVQATAGWSQIEFDDYTGVGGNDLSGNEVPFLPAFTAGLAMRYDFESGFFVSSGVRAVGATYFEEGNSRDFKQGSYEVWDAQVGYEAENWSAVVFARNLFDEDYYTFMNNQIAAGSPGDPQVFGVRVGLEF